MRKLVLITAVLVAGVAAMVGATTASARHSTPLARHRHREGTGVIKRFTTSYTAPSNTSIPVEFLKEGQHVQVLCFREGQVLDGNPIWFLIRHNELGYVHRDSISVRGDIRHC
jgi:hypothetical protein